MPQTRRGRGRRTSPLLRDAPSGRAPAPLLRILRFIHSFASGCRFLAGGLGGAVTPVPFPNTDVKGPRGDGTTPRSVGEQRAAGLLLKGPLPRSRRGRGPFSFPHGAEAARLHALCAGLSPRIFMPRAKKRRASSYWEAPFFFAFVLYYSLIQTVISPGARFAQR